MGQTNLEPHTDVRLDAGQWPSDPLSQICCAGLLVLGVFWCAARFWGLEHAPYGIWMDESRVALHTICLAETGAPAGDQDWPLFAPAFGGGHHPSILIYFELAWTKLFGSSIASFRSGIALINLLTIGGLVLIARRLGGRLLALLVFVSAAISPWSFQFSRIVWEGPFGAACLVFAVYSMLQAPSWRWAVAAGVFGGLAMFSYPPFRIATPLVMTFVGVIQLRRRGLRWRVRELAVAVAAMFVTFAPVLVMTLQGRLSARAMDVVIFSERYLDKHRGAHSRTVFFFSQFFDNLFSHFRPSFLFFSGDANTRHSPHLVGQLAPIDALALIAVAIWLTLYVQRALRSATGLALDGSSYRRKLLLCASAGVLGFVFASIPAALTWDGEPHSLRSIAAWPWACLAGAAALTFWTSLRPRLVLPAIVLGTSLYTLYYLPNYFSVWKTVPVAEFRRDVRAAVEARGHKPLLEVLEPFLDAYPQEELRYYLMRWGGYDCQSSEPALHALQQEHDAIKRNRRRKRQKN
jgi:4-amino-4-deoxy-L-arabinose transferase-like glycosyltransferase